MPRTTNRSGTTLEPRRTDLDPTTKGTFTRNSVAKLGKASTYSINDGTVYSTGVGYYDLDGFLSFATYTPNLNDVVKIRLNGVEMHFTGVTKIDNDEIRMSTLLWSNGTIPNLHTVSGEVETLTVALTSYAANERRLKDFLSISKSDGATVLNGIAASVHAIPICGNSAGMIAVRSDESEYARLYWSTDGATWALVNTASTGHKWSSAGFATSTGRLIIWRYRQAGGTPNTTTGIWTNAGTYIPNRTGVQVGGTGATPPTGITEGTTYYLRRIDETHFTLHPTPADVDANTNIVIPSDTGSGTYYTYFYSPYYSDDNGANWAMCASSDVANGTPAMTGAPEHWSTFEADNGTICTTTYSLLAAGTLAQIWRSTDNGLTWNKVKELPKGAVTHIHTVARHPVTERWYANTGDGATKQFDMYSDDDGLTWLDWKTNSETIETMAAFVQTLVFKDYGHPTRMAFVGDQLNNLCQVGWIDFNNWTMGSFLDIKTRELDSSGNWYGFTKRSEDGLWYASKYGRIGGLYVSPDLHNWACYHTFSYNTTAVGLYQYVGTYGGKMHWKIQEGSTFRQFAISPAKISLRSGILLSPAKTNLLSSSVSKCETTTGLEVNASPLDLTLATDDTVTFAGSSSIKISKASATRVPHYMRFPGVSTEAGKTYVAHFWVKGNVKYATPYVYGTSGQAIGGDTPDEISDKWTEIWSLPMTANSVKTIQPALVVEPMYDTIELWVGAAELVDVISGDWSEGGVAQAAEDISHSLLLPANWTHVFNARIIPNSWEMGLVRHNLATYKINDSNYLSLTYGVSATYTNTDFACADGDANNPVVTSAGASFTAADVGRRISLAGSNFTYAVYVIRSVTNSTTIVLDRACGADGASSGGTGVVYTNTFALEATGVGTGSVSLDTYWLDRGTQVRIAVRHQKGTVDFRLSDTRIPQTSSGLILTTPLSGAITLRTGGVDGTLVVPHYRSDEYLYFNYVDDTKIDLGLVDSYWRIAGNSATSARLPSRIGIRH